jgi:simple sugar transport system permease protein
MIQVGLVLAGAPGHFFRTLTGFIVVAAVILNTSVARRMARSKPLGGFRRESAAADAAIAAILDKSGESKGPASAQESAARAGVSQEQAR